jgi:PAS domain S-box-containing protein
MRFLDSVRSLYIAVGILLLTLCIGVYVDGRNETMHARHLAISTGLEKMVRLNQQLTNMLLIAVLERNALRATTYDTVNTDMEETIKAVAHLTKMQNLPQEIAALSEGHDKIHAVEEDIIKLMNTGKWKEARSVLFGNEYVLAKKTYDVDNEIAVSTVMGELAATTQRFSRIRIAALGMRLGALLLLLLVGVMFSRRIRADLSEQVRLRNEISAAYEAMEVRVRERTADLEETSKRLALENEERLRSDARTRLILNSAGEGIFGVDTQERVTFFNMAAEKLLGYGADEVMGKEIHSLIHHSYADGAPYLRENCPMVHAVAHGEQRDVVDEVLWRKDGSWFLSEYSVMGTFDDNGAIDGAVVVIRDITARKSSEEELNRRMADLERFNRLTMGREEKMIQLKGEINTLLEEMGREKKYKAVENGQQGTDNPADEKDSLPCFSGRRS